MSDSREQRITELEMSLAHMQRMFDQLNEVVTAQNLDNVRTQRRLDRLQDQIKQLKEKPEEPSDPLDEKPPHY